MSGQDDELLLKSHVRAFVLNRDGGVCRGCGAWCEAPHVHHIIYRSQGGKDLPDNLISLDWQCHSMVHSNKPLWLPVLQQLTVTPGVNGLQLLRWYRAKEQKHV